MSKQAKNTAVERINKTTAVKPMKNAGKLFLIGLLAWHGFAAGDSKSQLLSGLQGMGMLGFYHGTISKKDVGESSFLDAVERGGMFFFCCRGCAID